MGRTLYTYSGLAKLGQIVRTARGRKSVRSFARKTGLSHATITRLENEEVKEPEIATLQKLAPHVGYNKEELIAICEDSPRKSEVRIYRLAEEVLPIIEQLPNIEAAKIAQAIIARLVE
ncbi:helix-turn-helix transcriptional regulator [Aetokthonos hydrillicola Thurmond2011]|jgi:transcriptional regulator with XRE-family HTH domain|uniref:Helix-turn-helix transcriptional regulator n=1 Tax=Aetokthonos hydrillicola Thurmond2011 TaxID=2712845 RepID=A0AAP5I523_9CYAN|nr:helix-turn-helix transcriptional regulator [Aetokthonos hydrillicola]MBO3462875.1 helix-turn-helix transcriptional regulator [Aetokthonos hydrillicola CCALA 1050]MDR9893218.1 helix-turn-helix transcriptional regulator [Aetokthonos hydrillicola Thurmond2011]